jgi:hypothetical protein
VTKPMPLSWTTLRSAPLVLALLAGAFLAPSAARADDCTWGQPGYRDCVDGKFARQRELEAQNKPREVMKTVPASKRPGTLTPLPPPPPAMMLPDMDITDGRAATARNQRQTDANQARIRRDAGRDPIMPLPTYPLPMPGQVCPIGGC